MHSSIKHFEVSTVTAVSTYYKLIGSCQVKFLQKVISDMEAAKMFGIQFQKEDETLVHITAWYNNGGACYDTGRAVSLRSKALIAAIDDDNHFIFDSFRVCEKTAQVYLTSAYRDFISVGEPESEKYQRLATDPIPFDCCTFEDDAERAYGLVQDAVEQMNQTVMYCGPFRMLILKNGAIARRGVPVSLSSEQVSQLHLDGYRFLDMGAQFAATPNYKEVYEKYGPLCIINPHPAANISLPCFSALQQLPEKLYAKIKTMVKKQHDYFILQGGDPRMQNVCCSNPLVPKAKELVEAGILDAYYSEDETSCTMNIFALKGESNLAKGAVSPTFSKNELLRQVILELMTAVSEEKGSCCGC